MHSQSNVNVRAFSLPVIKVQGKKQIPVVVYTEQGLNSSPKNRELVPVGAAAGADDREDFVSDLHAQEKGTDAKKFPLRVFYLVDISSSMGQPSLPDCHNPQETKLQLVQQRIEELAQQLPEDEDIEHVLIPYDNHARQPIVCTSKQKLISEVKNLRIAGSTNIYAPLRSAINYLHDYKDDQKRNLMILVSDGHDNQSKSGEIVKTAELLPQFDAGVFSVGVGIGYNEALMREIVEAAGYGGIAHIPEESGDRNVLKEVVPAFINEMASSVFFAVTKFSNWFDKVFHAHPSIRKVLQEKSKERDYKATVGYQREGMSVGFVDEEKGLDNAGIQSVIKEAANGDVINSNDIPIVPLEDAVGLDHKLQEIIKQAPYRVLAKDLLDQEDHKAIEKFLEDNPNLDTDLKNRLGFMQALINKQVNDLPLTPGETQAAMSMTSNSIGGTVLCSVNPFADSVLPQPSPGDTQAGHYREETICSRPVPQRWDSMTIAAVQNPKDAGDHAVTFNLKGATVFRENNLPRNKEGNIVLADSKQIKLGRGSDCDIVFDDQMISHYHCIISNRGGKLYMKDTSRNGTLVNRQQIQEVELRNGDKVGIGNNTFTIVIS